MDIYAVDSPIRQYYNSNTTVIPDDWMFNQTDHHVLYGQVTETQPDGSYITSQYSVAGLTENVSGLVANNPDQLTFYQNTYGLRGLLLQRDYYSSSGTKLKEEQFTPSEGIRYVYYTSPSNILYESVWDSAETEAVTTYDQNGQNGVTATVTTKYDAASGLPATVTETNSDGIKRITTTTYPGDYVIGLGSWDNTTLSLLNMQERNMQNYEVERTVSSQKPNDNVRVESSTLVLYDFTKWLNPGSILAIRSDSSLTDFVPAYVNGSEHFIYDSRYQTQTTYDAYDIYSNLLRSTDANGTVSNYIYGADSSQVIAVIANAYTGESGYTGLEDGGKGWECVVLKKVDTIIRIFFSLCYFLSFVESVDKLKTHAAYLAEGVW